MHQEFEPPAALQDAIKCFWYDSRTFGPALSELEVMPDGFAEIIFHFGSGCSISHNGISKSLPSPFMMGLLHQPVLVQTKNRFQIIAIRCYPWTVFDLLGLPSGKAGVPIFEHPIAQLQPALNEFIKAEKIEEAVALVKQYFVDARAHVAVDSMLYKAGIAMTTANGGLMHDGRGLLLDFTANAALKSLTQEYGDQVKYVSGRAKETPGLSALLVRPDGIVAWIAETGADETGFQEAADRWFVRW